MARTSLTPITLALHRPACDPDMDDREQLEIAHELTRFHRAAMPRLNRRIATFVRDANARIVTGHTDDVVETLPEAVLPETSLADVLAVRRSVPRQALSGTIAPGELSALLSLAAGTNGADATPTRSYPSAGALYPCDIHVLRPGQPACRYDGQRHALVPQGVIADVSLAETGQPVSAPPCALVITGNFARTMTKYGGRGYRFAILEAGHISQNLVLAATALGLPSLVYGSFYDAELERMLGIDGVGEAVLAVVLVGGATS